MNTENSNNNDSNKSFLRMLRFTVRSEGKTFKRKMGRIFKAQLRSSAQEEITQGKGITKHNFRPESLNMSWLYTVT